MKEDKINCWYNLTEDILAGGVYLPSAILTSKSFIDFTTTEQFKLWLFLTTCKIDYWNQGNDLFGYIAKTYYEDKNLITAVCTDDEIAESLGLKEKSSIIELKGLLADKGFIQIERFEFGNKPGECYVLGEYSYMRNADYEKFYAYEICLREDAIRSDMKSRMLEIA